MTPEIAKAILNFRQDNHLITPGHSVAELAAFVRRLERLRERRFVFASNTFA